MPRTIKKRVDRKSQTGGNITGKVGDIRERLRQKQRTLVYGLAAFLVAVSAIVAVVVYTRTTATRSHELEFEGQNILSSPATQYPNPSDRYKYALDKFKQSYEAAKKPALLLQIADCYYALGEYDQAIKTLNELNAQASDTRILSLSYFKLASAYARKGDTSSALKAYGNMVGLKDAGLQDLALLESGRLYEAMGKKVEAKAKYDELKKKFPKSPLSAGVNTGINITSEDKTGEK
jgi:tetratricopeptide (TPR) repeat protein